MVCQFQYPLHSHLKQFSVLKIIMAVANATLVSKHPSTIMIEQPATNNRKLEMEAKHDLELGRIKNERELQVDNNDQKHKHKETKKVHKIIHIIVSFPAL